VMLGLIWSLWHLPLFVLPGVGQHGTNFAIFVIGIVGEALILAWLYGCTKSIFLCILFHAGWNAIAALGLTIPSHRHLPAILDASFRVLLGALLLAFGSASPNKPFQRTGKSALPI